MKAHLPILCAVLTLAAAASAQQAPSTPPAKPASPPSQAQPATPVMPPPTCDKAEFKQFDFWVGSWNVLNPSGAASGTSDVVRVANGCAILEQWLGGAGGTSLNYYDETDGAWHQVWVGAGGRTLHLKGGFQEGKMVMTGERTTPKGPVKDRLSWTPLPEGGVLQEWEMSIDGGKTWRKTFSGKYVKR